MDERGIEAVQQPINEGRLSTNTQTPAIVKTLFDQNPQTRGISREIRFLQTKAKAIEDPAERVSLEQLTKIFEGLRDLTPEQLREQPPEEYLKTIELMRRSASVEPAIITEVISHNLEVVVDRFAGDPRRLAGEVEVDPSLKYYNLDLAHNICEQTRHIFWMLAGSKDFRMDSRLIERLYENLESNNFVIREQASEYIHDLIVLDNRNKRLGGEYLNIFNRFQEDLQKKLLSDSKLDWQMAQFYIEEAWANMPGLLPGLLERSLLAAESTEQIRRVYALIVNRLPEGDKTALKILMDPTKPEEFQQKAKQVLVALGFMPETGESATAKALYERFDIGHWSPNDELLLYEKDLLVKQFKPGHKILDVGCGVGRHMQVLREQGYTDLVGIDQVYKNVKAAKDNNPDNKVVCASWYNTSFKDRSFDDAYCLGRSFPHNFTRRELDKFFQEQFRILKNKERCLVRIKAGGVPRKIPGTEVTSQENSCLNSASFPNRRLNPSIMPLCAF